MKRLFSKVMVLFMCIMMIPGSAFADEKKPELEIRDAIVPTGIINKDDVVRFGMTLRNNSEGNMKDITIKISGGFYAVNESAERKIKEIRKGADEAVSPFVLKYDGNEDNRIIVNIEYRVGDSEKKIKTVFFQTSAKPGKSGHGIPNNSELYKPSLVLINGEQPVIKGDEAKEIIVKFKNNSKYKMKNVKFTGDFTNSKFELVEIASSKQFDEIQKNEQKELRFKVRGKDSVETGVYPIKINAEFTNEYNNEFQNSFEIYVKYISNKTQNKIEITELNEKQNIVSGNDFKLELNIKNTSEETITDAVVKLVDLDGKQIINRAEDMVKLQDLAAGASKKASIEMIVNSKLETGNYPVKIQFTYKNKSKKQVTITKTIFKKVKHTKSDIFIGSITSSKQVIQKDQEFTVKVPVINYGEKKAEKIKVSINGEGFIYSTGNSRFIEEIQPKGRKIVEFRLKAISKIEEGNKKINVVVKENDNEKIESFIVYAKKDETGKSVPKVIISKYKVNPVMVKAGKNFDLKVVFKNTHKTKTIRNMKVTLTTPQGSSKTGSVFSPVNSSNTFYISEIKPGAESEMNITMYTVPDAAAKTYTIDVNMNYEDEKGNNVPEANDIIGIPVRQPSKFMTSDINLPASVKVEKNITIEFDVNNTGKVDLTNFMVRLVGDFKAKESKSYIGTIKSGDREYCELAFKATKEGLNRGEIIFSYEEPSGEVVEVKREIVAEAKMPELDIYKELNDIKVEEKKGFPIQTVLIIAVPVVLIVGFIIIRKKKKEKDSDE